MLELASPASLADLLAPHPVERFVAAHWEARPLHVRRAARGFYDAALPPEQLARLAFELEQLGRDAAENPNNVRGPIDVLGTAEVRGAPVGEELGPEARLPAYERGATLRVNDAQHRALGVRALCETIGRELGAVVGANLYVARAGAPTTGLHVDPHDIYVLQLKGKKRWQLFEGARALPVVSSPQFSFQKPGHPRGPGPKFVHHDLSGCGAPIDDLVLEEGDLLYAPRGTYHLVTPVDCDTMHLTIGAWPLTAIDLLLTALGEAAERDPRLRRGL
ncbi:MAG TPA: cupin domain-containing protein, partial [Minicystis sp.]|nr:cupin domain-containing protein [Minicystis sp.]